MSEIIKCPACDMVVAKCECDDLRKSYTDLVEVALKKGAEIARLQSENKHLAELVNQYQLGTARFIEALRSNKGRE